MCDCRSCSDTPFGRWFNSIVGNSDAPRPAQSQPRGAEEPQVENEADEDSKYSETDSEGGTGSADQTDRPLTFEPRTADEIHALVRSWDNYVHPRAKEFWTSSDMLYEILSQVLRGVHRADDPILGSEEGCVLWHGEVDSTMGPVIRMMRPNENVESSTGLTRVLAFLFADDESFGELQQRTRRPFQMACQNSRCINLTHISLDD
uniref:Uncharacterized protein n=1 Tax=Chromera velia CCMP2878 TaxID=1169474 RepID=A0A0G4I413_9ALVE|mmetsp:Transcript_13853/g.27612  ORF Transcript_13853/g.27612 Transcript_13853/m.27612 type:complete len:205 (-) Transcript_13853:32-646(-)|eukprot:Cvel_10768.t1-p1 / transcript=Cvel_10768.t1 / gene=Cvel_10768 / organism=Chromera_velia_CCMP2878 / gene_product=hypothetical protein / transcript_product=hypothetical protein / location=Cvel_scaffold657:58149-59763(+) / protein_length=204 / sequence_SO=supercontig / SO=protein_coding / is_pseudo=false